MKILISGAGIAGATLAYWLKRAGHEPIVIEKAKDGRTSGQAVEISSAAAKQIASMMGLDARLSAMGTTEAGLRFVDTHGTTVAEFGIDKKNGRSFTSENEILRSDLVALLYELTQDVEYRYDEYITSIGDEIGFNSGRSESFDLLIICDGLYSKTRQLAGFEADIKAIGQTSAYFTVNEVIDMEDKYAKWYTTTKGRAMLTRPDRTGRNTRAYLSIMERFNYLKMIPAEQKAYFRTQFSGSGYVVDRILDGMDATDDFYVTELAQVRCDK